MTMTEMDGRGSVVRMAHMGLVTDMGLCNGWRE